VVSVNSDSDPLLQLQRLPPMAGQERPEWPLRLRCLQWGGRPGPLVQEGTPMVGGRFLLEWPLPSPKCWPLPPTSVPRASSTKASGGGTKFRCQGMPAFSSWLHSGAASTAHEAATPGASMAEGPEQAVLIRVLSLLVPRELWLSVGINATLGMLYQEIAKILRRESPLLADLCRPIHFHLMDSQAPKRKAAVPDTRPLRELFWAQSETVRVELESSKLPLLVPGAGVCQKAGSAGGSPIAVLIWREQAFMEVPAMPSDRPVASRCTAAALGCWTRQVSEPLQLQQFATWTRQQSEPAPSGGALGFTRQLSEPLTTSEDWRREFSEPAPLPSLSGPAGSSWLTSASPCYAAPEAAEAADISASGDRLAVSVLAGATLGNDQLLAGGHPGDTALDVPEDFAHTQEVASGARASGLTWERIVPHYPPQLLPRTLLTRQFEFHPTLPQVLLTGDKKGSVNILDTESDEVHQPLVVGSCPLLGLVWMRHHPQQAVCGASHSGKIMFLKYDPHARLSEPALQRLHTVEDFPKLSSLSSNCTDDFLLASGISPNVAVYDVQTGKVLHRAHGVHEHFINISRFSHNSPHIFATASFDHTCKVWDLRQPLKHDMPVKTLNTGSHNVMCVFSPDDRHVLCSGVDTRIMQFEVPSWRQTPEQFPLREPVHRERYRRSTYLASGQHFVTAATEESHMHVLSVDGKKLGVVDFRGVVQDWVDKGGQGIGGANSAAEPCCLQVPRLAAQLESRILAGRAPWPFAGAQRSPICGWQEHRIAGLGPYAVGKPDHLVTGAVQLDDADLNGGSSRNNHEFIQSIRTHPVVKNRVGVLLSLTQAEQSYVALVDMDPRIVDR